MGRSNLRVCSGMSLTEPALMPERLMSGMIFAAILLRAVENGKRSSAVSRVRGDTQKDRCRNVRATKKAVLTA